MKLYERFNYLSCWFRYKATYLEMKYHLKQVLKGKREYYLKPIMRYDRNIGKSVALARLSVKYDIPIIVPTNIWKSVIERDIPMYLPKYFKRKKPEAIVATSDMRGIKFKVVLLEEMLTEEQMREVNYISNGKYVGYRNIDHL